MSDLHEKVVTMINDKSRKVNQVSLIKYHVILVHCPCDPWIVLLVTRHDGHKAVQSTDIA